MDQTTVSSKFQVVIPKPARDHARLRPGQKLMVLVKHGVISLVPILTLDELEGIAEGANVEGYREGVDRL